jgi:hypothetical protein
MNENMFADQVEETSLPNVARALQTIIYGGVCVGILDGLAATIHAAIKGRESR